MMSMAYWIKFNKEMLQFIELQSFTYIYLDLNIKDK